MFTESKAVIFDTEYTAWPGSMERRWSSPGEYREVVQIGAVKVKTVGDMREVDSFQILVQPQKNPILSEYFVNLTGITQEKIEKGGVIFPQALLFFTNFIGENPVNILSNGGDHVIIEENCQIHKAPVPSVFEKSINLRHLFSEALGIPPIDCVSGMLPELFGLDSDKRSHDALEDARSIAQALRHLLLK